MLVLRNLPFLLATTTDVVLLIQSRKSEKILHLSRSLYTQISTYVFNVSTRITRKKDIFYDDGVYKNHERKLLR